MWPQVAKLTHDISIFTEGILMMKTTLVGIIKVKNEIKTTWALNGINREMPLDGCVVTKAVLKKVME